MLNLHAQIVCLINTLSLFIQDIQIVCLINMLNLHAQLLACPIKTHIQDAQLLVCLIKKLNLHAQSTRSISLSNQKAQSTRSISYPFNTLN